MADTSTKNSAARVRAQKHFGGAPPRDSQVKQDIEHERAALVAKSARLRALRLAKEEEDREAARIAALSAPPPKPKKKRRVIHG